MYKQYSERQGYLDHFAVQKILPLWIEEAAFIVIYMIFAFLENYDLDFWDILQSFLIGKTVIIMGWYLQVIILVYIFFFLFFKLHIGDREKIVLMFSAVVIYIAIAYMASLPGTWYQTVLMFPVGILVAHHSRKMSIHRNVVVPFVCLGLYAVCMLGRSIDTLPDFVRLTLTILSELFVLTIIIYCSMLPSGKLLWLYSFLTGIGKYSLEVYCFQGLCFELLKKTTIPEHTLRWFIVVLTLLSVMSLLMKAFMGKVRRFISVCAKT